jgi:hypothetical protein
MAGRAAASAGKASEEAFAAVHRELLADRSIQFELSRFEPPRPPNWLRPLGDFLRDIFPVLEVLFWMLLAGLVLFLLYAMARRLSGAEWPWRRRPQEDGEALLLQPEQGSARRLLSEADALAAQGRYSEASHLLLFRSIEDIDSRRPNVVRPALTSRDIASLGEIPPVPRSAFGRLVMAVEHSLFGGRSLGAEDWRDCRSAYEEFAFAEGWRG